MNPIHDCILRIMDQLQALNICHKCLRLFQWHNLPRLGHLYPNSIHWNITIYFKSCFLALLILAWVNHFELFQTDPFSPCIRDSMPTMFVIQNRNCGSHSLSKSTDTCKKFRQRKFFQNVVLALMPPQLEIKLKSSEFLL